jgi:hypothetical protein
MDARYGIFEPGDTGGIVLQFKPDKFKELVLYIAGKCMEDATFGATKLNKILYFADFFAYADWGTPITGATYMKARRGPAPRELPSIRDELMSNGSICMREVPYYGYPQERVVPTREANLALFTAKDIALVDDIIQKLWGINAADISEYTHRLAGWRIAEDQDNIPYESVFLSDEALTRDDVERAKELSDKLGWLD